jgi:hypothetical protein
MAMGKRRRRAKQASMWVATQALLHRVARPFYQRLNLGPEEVVADQGYHSNQVLVSLAAIPCVPTFRSPIAGGATGRTLRRATRSIAIEASAGPGATGCCDTGASASHDRLHISIGPVACDACTCAVVDNILKRTLLHTGALNLGLLMGQPVSIGTPRSLQGRVASLLVCLRSLVRSPEHLWNAIGSLWHPLAAFGSLHARRDDRRIAYRKVTTSATGCG